MTKFNRALIEGNTFIKRAYHMGRKAAHLQTQVVAEYRLVMKACEGDFLAAFETGMTDAKQDFAMRTYA